MDEYEVINIPISDGTEREFAIMNTFEVKEKSYMAVSLIEDDVIVEGVYLYKYTPADDGDVIVATISDDEEYAAVKLAYENL
ncbi:MAG: DUF1292 domain-containing protein [Lachnospiraceae bacterium]|nr:DUF1292 domain-containing protein [Lachnospiraceae bacterium]MDD3615689.1 DUF1292 domain-containing protein [Lachnospiraceae bacterium]